MRSVSSREWIFLAIILIYSFVPTFGGLYRITELLGGPAIVPENPRALAHPLPIVLHILSSFLFCLLGALQFLPNIRRHRLGLHRMMGRVVAAAGCTSALTGLWMTHFYAFPQELQGSLLYSVRIVLSLSMVGLIVWAVIAIRSQNPRRAQRGNAPRLRNRPGRLHADIPWHQLDGRFRDRTAGAAARRDDGFCVEPQPAHCRALDKQDACATNAADLRNAPHTGGVLRADFIPRTKR